MGEIVGPVLVSAVVGALVWLLIKRNVERGDRERASLKNEVSELRDERVKKVERDVEHAQRSRSKIYQDITDIRGKFVHKGECTEQRDEMMQRIAGFNESVLKLERVSERTNTVMKLGDRLLQQMISVKEDVASITARVESLNGHRNEQS